MPVMSRWVFQQWHSLDMLSVLDIRPANSVAFTAVCLIQGATCS